MRGDSCSPVWRLAALLLGTNWVVVLAVACGGGEDVGAAPAAASPGVTQQLQVHGATAAPAVVDRPCAGFSHPPRPPAAPPVEVPPAAVPAPELSDQALQLPAGGLDAGAAVARTADPFETTN